MKPFSYVTVSFFVAYCLTGSEAILLVRTVSNNFLLLQYLGMCALFKKHVLVVPLYLLFSLITEDICSFILFMGPSLLKTYLSTHYFLLYIHMKNLNGLCTTIKNKKLIFIVIICFLYYYCFQFI